MVAVRHGDGTVLKRPPASPRIVDAIRAHADRLPEVIETRDALETKIAALAAARRTDDDLARIDDALAAMEPDIEAGGRGVEGDERFHGAVTAAAHSLLLARLMDEIGDLIKERGSSRSPSPAGHATRSPGTARSPRRSGPVTPRRPRAPCTSTSRWSATSPSCGETVTGWEQLAVVAAGFGAGIMTSTVGVASLLSFPVLVAVGLPPVVANASNTVGMTPAGLSGSFGYRRELRRAPGGDGGRDRDLRRRVGGGRDTAARPAARGLRADRALADPLHLPARRRPADR